jgi:hypothetical protein
MARNNHLVLIYAAGAVAVVFAIIFALIPFQSSVLYMDRRTGERITHETDWYFIKTATTTDVPSENHERLSSYGDLTAPRGLVELQRTERRFPWSDHRVEDGKGSRIGEVFYALFQDVGLLNPSNRPIEEREFKVLMKKRIAIWNSNFPEIHSDADRKKIIMENKEMIKKLMIGQ